MTAASSPECEASPKPRWPSVSVRVTKSQSPRWLTGVRVTMTSTMWFGVDIDSFTG